MVWRILLLLLFACLPESESESESLSFSLLGTVGEASTEMKASLWQAKEPTGEKTRDLALEHLVTLPDHSEKLQG